MPDLHTALEAAITARLEVARAAKVGGDGTWHLGTRGGWLIEDDAGEPVVHDEGSPTEEQAAHIALHDPADAVRRYERELGLIERYRRLDAEPVGRLTHEEILEYDGQLELLRELIDDLLDVYPEVTR